MEEIIRTSKVSDNHCSVQFLGKTFQLPKEIPDYVKYLNLFNEFYNADLKILIKQINNREYAGGSEEDFRVWSEPLKKQGQEVIEMLLNMGVYDITIEDLVINNQGYQKLNELCATTLDKMRIILRDAIGNYIDEMDRNRAKAAETITGSGVSIITNSVTSALAYSFMEARTLSNQAKEADALYRESMKVAGERNTTEQKRKENNVLNNIYYPGVKECLNLFTAEMLFTFLTSLNSHGIFNYDSVKHYNIERSNQLIRNIAGKNKTIVEGVLIEAFKNCPYNSNIFIAALDNGLLNKEELNTARIVGIDSEIAQYLIEQCKKSEELYLGADFVEKLSILQDTDPRTIIINIFNKYYHEININYSGLLNLNKAPGSLFSWRKRYIADDDDFLNMSESEIKKKVVRHLHTICSENEFNYLCKFGLIKIKGVPDSYCSDYQNLNNYITDTLTNDLVLSKDIVEKGIKEKEKLKLLKEAEIEAEKKAKELANKRKKKMAIRIGIISLCAVILLLIGKSIIDYININYTIPKQKYDQAVSYMEEKKYDQAIQIFSTMEDYKDSKELKKEAEELKKEAEDLIETEETYALAVDYFEDEKYEEALKEFKTISEYSDSLTYIDKIYDIYYNEGIKAYNRCEFEDAESALAACEDYKDSADILKIIQNMDEQEATYLRAKYSVDNSRSYEYYSAIEVFIELGDYKDSKDYLKKCVDLINEDIDKDIEEGNYQSAIRGLEKLNKIYDVDDRIKELNARWRDEHLSERGEKAKSNNGLSPSVSYNEFKTILQKNGIRSTLELDDSNCGKIEISNSQMATLFDDEDFNDLPYINYAIVGFDDQLILSFIKIVFHGETLDLQYYSYDKNRSNVDDLLKDFNIPNQISLGSITTDGINSITEDHSSFFYNYHWDGYCCSCTNGEFYLRLDRPDY